MNLLPTAKYDPRDMSYILPNGTRIYDILLKGAKYDSISYEKIKELIRRDNMLSKESFNLLEAQPPKEVELNFHCFAFGEKINGEGLELHTTFLSKENVSYLTTNQELVLYSHTNSAVLRLSNFVLNPDSLRSLADQLEKAYNDAIGKPLASER